MKGLLFFLIGFGAFNNALAQTTQVTIRALAKDAKFIGTGIGGAFVIVKNHYTQEVLAKGYTTGTSGDTKVIINNPRIRHTRITDDQTAKFVAELDIDEPTLVDIHVVAPYNRRHAAIESSTQLWAIPGKHIAGDGVILEIPGFIVDILSPHTHHVLDASTEEEVSLKVHVVMMCGCVIQQGGLWNADHYEVSAIVKKEGKEIARLALVKAAADNIFETKFPIHGIGNYEVIVTAFDQAAHNTGVDKLNFVVR